MAGKDPFESSSEKWATSKQSSAQYKRTTTTASGSADLEELRRSITELGVTVAEELGRGVKSGLDQVQKTYQENQKRAAAASSQATPKYAAPNVQQVRQAQKNINAAVNKSVNNLSDSLNNGLPIMGGTISVGGTIASAVIALTTTFYGILMGDPIGIVIGIIFLIFTALLGFLSGWLFSLPGARLRRKRYLAAMGEQTSVPLDRLCEAVQRPLKFVKKDISKMIRKGWLPNAFVDDQENRFFLHAEEYRELQKQQEEQRRQEAQKQARREEAQQDPEKAELMAIMEQGGEFIEVLDVHIKETENIPQINDELRTMKTKAQDILKWVASHPASMTKVRKFVRYYMPTTIKLLNTYDDVKHQQGEVAGNIRLEIAGVLNTVNRAFENLRDNLLSDAALDISTEISAMETMLAQDGFSVKDNLYSKE